MVNFRICEDFDPLFKNLVVPSDEDWDSLRPTVLIGKYMRYKATGSLYRVRGIYHCPDFKTKGYRIRKSGYEPYFGSPDYFPVRFPSRDLKDIFQDFRLQHQSYQSIITLSIIFRNDEDYLRAEEDLNICKTHVLDIPILSSQLNAAIPKIYRRFENLVETRKEILYLYKPND